MVPRDDALGPQREPADGAVRVQAHPGHQERQDRGLRKLLLQRRKQAGEVQGFHRSLRFVLYPFYSAAGFKTNLL